MKKMTALCTTENKNAKQKLGVFYVSIKYFG
jgi:hypothetical protein